MGNVWMDRSDKHPELISKSEADIVIMILYSTHRYLWYSILKHVFQTTVCER